MKCQHSWRSDHRAANAAVTHSDLPLLDNKSSAAAATKSGRQQPWRTNSLFFWRPSSLLSLPALNLFHILAAHSTFLAPPLSPNRLKIPDQTIQVWENPWVRKSLNRLWFNYSQVFNVCLWLKYDSSIRKYLVTRELLVHYCPLRWVCVKQLEFSQTIKPWFRSVGLQPQSGITTILLSSAFELLSKANNCSQTVRILNGSASAFQVAVTSSL